MDFYLLKVGKWTFFCKKYRKMCNTRIASRYCRVIYLYEFDCLLKARSNFGTPRSKIRTK